MSGKMQQDYDHLLNIDHDSPYRIPLSAAEPALFTGGRSSERLDGRWNFSVDVFDTFTRKRFFDDSTKTDEQGRAKPVDFDFDGWEETKVPSCWNLQKERYYYYEGSCVYTRTFHYQPRESDERVFLRIGAANYESRVWLNGRLLSRHRGGFTPHFVELTGQLRENNRLIVTVNNRRELDQVPSLNYDWFNYGGITRSVQIFRTPPLFIKDLFVALAPDGSFGNIQIQVRLSEEQAGLTCQVRIPELNIQETLTTDETGGATAVVAARPELWDCDRPRLYQVVALSGKDRVEDQVGFREIRVEGKDILLNGKPLFLKGVCCHEESTQTGRVMDDGERLQIIHTAKDLGCNILRLSHYPHSERMARLADREGMLLWEEIPVYWALEFENPETLADAQSQMRELIFRDRNRASVIIWSVGNENPDTDARYRFMKSLADICRELDDTRPVSAACLVDIDVMEVKDRLAEVVDIVSFNQYYGWYYRNYDGLDRILERTKLEKPLLISETGAGALPGHFGGEEELFTEEHQAKMYREQFSRSRGKIQGIFPWILFDFRSPIRLHPMQGQHNRKGLAAFDKSYRKLAFEVVAKEYEDVF